MNNELEFSTDATAEHIRGLGDSATLINKLIADNVKNEETMDCMDRNVRHIGIMCAMDHIKNSDNDLSPYLAAQSAGVAWMAS